MTDTQAPDATVEHALHYDPTCEECVYLARPVAVHVPVQAPDATVEALRTKAAFLADRAALAVAEPRRFHESADEQHDLSVAIADVRRVLAAHEVAEPADSTSTEGGQP